jgi:hypothetical protein
VWPSYMQVVSSTHSIAPPGSFSYPCAAAAREAIMFEADITALQTSSQTPATRWMLQEETTRLYSQVFYRYVYFLFKGVSFVDETEHFHSGAFLCLTP